MNEITDTGIKGFLKWFATVQPDLYKKVAPTVAQNVPAAFSDYRQAVADLVLAKAQMERAKILLEKGAIAAKDLEACHLRTCGTFGAEEISKFPGRDYLCTIT